MIEKKLLELQSVLRAQGILISFSGRFSQAIIEELGNAVKTYMETEDKSKSEVYNVFAIFIEQTQNIKNYCHRKQASIHCERIANSAIVAIGKCDQGYFICSGNLVETADTFVLASRLAQLEKLDKDGLKKLYKEQIKKELLPGTDGAGVGMIDMARKASAPMEYSLVRIDDEFAFYTLKVII